jgi:hypothetical protein
MLCFTLRLKPRKTGSGGAQPHAPEKVSSSFSGIGKQFALSLQRYCKLKRTQTSPLALRRAAGEQAVKRLLKERNGHGNI